jgi:hypothetical protein
MKYEDTTPESRKKALDDAWKVHNQKVFRIGDDAVDWIVAESEESAVTFYRDECGTPVEELYEMGVIECDVNDTLLFHKEDVWEQDLHLFQPHETNEELVYVPFTSSLYYFADKPTPYIIGTTEV